MEEKKQKAEEKVEEKKQKKKKTCQLKEKQQEEEYNESCPKCGLAYGTTNDDILWICCDDCDRWFDYKCSGLWSRRGYLKSTLVLIACDWEVL